jgi:hypothetical protein
MATVTCRTAGCGNEGASIELDLDYVDESTGETITIETVYCGSCGELITDVVPTSEGV